MSQRPSTNLQRALRLVAALLILKVTATVVWGYRNYLPPDFNSDFLHGRQEYFSGAYKWAFYPHLASGPVTLVLGMVLTSDRFRLRFPKWHRRFGRIQIMAILLIVSPSGLWMAWYAAAGPIATIAFSLLAVLTATCAALGWRAAVQRRFAVHRVWMSRCFLLLCSAVALRLIGGLATIIAFDAPWFDPLASWLCWLAPLAGYELVRNRRRLSDRFRRWKSAPYASEPAHRY